jgi:hypothetical protein
MKRTDRIPDANVLVVIAHPLGAQHPDDQEVAGLNRPVRASRIAARGLRPCDTMEQRSA